MRPIFLYMKIRATILYIFRPKMLLSLDRQQDRMMYNDVKYSCINMKHRDKMKDMKCTNNRNVFQIKRRLKCLVRI